MVRTYLVTNRQEVGDSVRFDLSINGVVELRRVLFMRAFTSVLEVIGSWDSFCYRANLTDEGDDISITGAELTHTHALRRMEVMQKPQVPCTRCEEPTVWIGYCDLPPYGPYDLQKTFFLQCRLCGLYRQVGFQNQEDWTGETYRDLMQGRIPFVRVAGDPFFRNGTLRVSGRTRVNPLGMVNLDGREYHPGWGIVLYDQDNEKWRHGRIECGDEYWYFTGDGGPDVVLRQGMRAKRLKARR